MSSASNAPSAVAASHDADIHGVGAQRKIHVIIDDGSDPLRLANEGTLSTKVAVTRTIMTGDGEWDAGWNSSFSVS